MQCGSEVPLVLSFFTFPSLPFYLAIRSIGRDTTFAVFFLFMYGYRFLSRSFTERHKILHGGSASSRTGLLLFWVDSPMNGRVLSVIRGHMAGYASCWSICLLPFFSDPPLSNINSTRKCGNYSDVLPLKAARRDSISNLTSLRASNLSCKRTQCHFI